MSDLTRIYGLTIRSEVPLHQHRPVPAGTPVDLEIVLGAPVAPTDATPPGRVLLDLRGSRHFYAATAVDRRLPPPVLRDLRRRDRPEPDPGDGAPGARRRPRPAVGARRRDRAGVRADAARRERCCTRARCRSATRPWRSSAPRAWGSPRWRPCSARPAPASSPTTCCVSTRQLPPTCALGATELRLRKGADDLAGRFATAPGLRTTGDARQALAAVPSTTEDLPLAALVVPLPDHSPGRRTAEITRLSPQEALVLLSQFPRVLGWQDAAVRRAGFHQLADVRRPGARPRRRAALGAAVPGRHRLQRASRDRADPDDRRRGRRRVVA